MTVDCLPLGEIGANCYYVCDGTTAVLADVGEYSDKLAAFLEDKPVPPSAILLTHGHFDHICGVADTAEKFGIPVYISAADKPCLYSTRASLALIANGYTQKKLPAGVKVTELNGGETFSVGTLTFRTLLLKGHTAGGIGYLTDGKLFVGDTVFRGSVGRTDLPGGNAEELRDSVRTVASLPDSTVIYCGHGEPTTVGYEKINNFYFR